MAFLELSPPSTQLHPEVCSSTDSSYLPFTRAIIRGRGRETSEITSAQHHQPGREATSDHFDFEDGALSSCPTPPPSALLPHSHWTWQQNEAPMDPFPLQADTNGLNSHNKCILPGVSMAQPLFEPLPARQLSVPESIMPIHIYDMAAQKQRTTQVDTFGTSNEASPRTRLTQETPVSSSEMVDEMSRQQSLTGGTKSNTKAHSGHRISAQGHLEGFPPLIPFRGTALQDFQHRSVRNELPERIVDLSDASNLDESTVARTNILPLRSPPPPADPVTNRYYVDYLLQRRARRRHRGRRRVVSYLVKWDGYGPEHNSWVLKRNISADLIEAFECRQKILSLKQGNLY